MVSAILTKMFGCHLAEYNSFLIASGASLLGCILGTFLTTATDKNVLSNFYKVTRPFGFWNMVKKDLSDEKQKMINEENNRDIVAIFFAVPWQIVLFLTGMMIIFKQWSNFFYLLILLIILSTGLYWFWFRHLSKEVKV